jgi:MFS family permease
MFLLFFCASSSGAILFFCVQIYTGIFLKTIVRMPPEIVDTLGIYISIALFPMIVFSGWLSDHIGRKPVLLAGLIIGTIAMYPAFEYMAYAGRTYYVFQSQIYLWGIGIAMLILAISLALVVGPQTALLAELFPAKNRNSAATLPHNLAAGWIGGMLPLIVTWLNLQFGSDLAGLWYPISFLGLAAIVATCKLPETRHSILSH